jgi:hypothetical protein
MAYTNSKAEKLELVGRLHEALNSRDLSRLDEFFAQDFKMTVPGAGGREVNDMPIPAGIAGLPHLVKRPLTSK